MMEACKEKRKYFEETKPNTVHFEQQKNNTTNILVLHSGE